MEVIFGKHQMTHCFTGNKTDEVVAAKILNENFKKLLARSDTS
jgi:hypothetical protein